MLGHLRFNRFVSTRVYGIIFITSRTRGANLCKIEPPATAALADVVIKPAAQSRGFLVAISAILWD